MLSKEARRKHNLLQTSLPYFAKHALKIKDKSGALIPFNFNQAQLYIHNKLEEQKMNTGKVRAIIVKARQMGSSTYLEGRYYHLVTRNKGKSVFILTHESESTKKIFDMAKRFHDNVPDVLRPAIKNSNAKELIFSDIDSRYYVGTAGSANVGRGGTVQYFHGSECAYWKNTDDIMTGVIQSVPELKGTEVVLESTANGIGNMFYQMTMQAARNEGQYQMIFIPWFWMDEYESDDTILNLDDEENIFLETYLNDYPEDKALKKMSWRRNKIKEFGKLWKFRQEYPSCYTEAFQVSGDSLINAEHIVKARDCRAKDKNAPMILGVDPARDGDRTVLVFRRGREVPHYYSFEYMDEMRLAGIISNLIEKHDIQMTNIDTAHGWGVIDRLKELGTKNINGIHFSGKAIESDVYKNIRAEMYCNMAKWINQEGVNIPDDDEFHADLTATPDIQFTSDRTIKLESKEKIKQNFGKSPDIADALALTFALPLKNKAIKVSSYKAASNRVGWKTK